MVGTGSKELIFLVMNIFNGDVILVSPGWTTYAPQVRLAKQKCFILQSSMEGQWKVTAENLESFIEEQKDIAKNRLLILNNPGNPSGMVYTANELKELSEVCRKLNITVLSDEIYGLLNFKGQHECMAKWYPEGTLVTSGFSKWSSAGAQWGKCLNKVEFKFICNNNVAKYFQIFVFSVPFQNLRRYLVEP